jgi:hypothetical protein
VSSGEIKKYVAVYIAMQRNHSLTIEQAPAAQGLTVAAFHELEQPIDATKSHATGLGKRVEGTQQTVPSHSGESASQPMPRP